MIKFPEYLRGEERARLAITHSAYWELSDCPVTVRLAMRQAEIDGRPPNRAARRCAKEMLKRVNDPMVRLYVSDIATATNVEKSLAALESYRDTLIAKVAAEFEQASRAPSISHYRAARKNRIGMNADRH